MRSKEEANDYRYFPCPDLLPVVITEARLQRLRDALPELPDARVARLIERYAIAAKDAQILANDVALANYFETVTKHCDDPRLAANWTTGELIGRLNGEGLELAESPIDAEQLGILIQRIGDQTISGKMAKQVFDGVWSGAGEVDQIIKERGLKQVSDSGALEQLVADVLAKNPAMIDDYLATEEGRRKKKLGGFMGRIMQASKGQANPQQVNQILLAQLQSLIQSRGD